MTPPHQMKPQDTIPLWSEGAPGALGQESRDIPTITPYLADPAQAAGAAMVICSGGGYGHLAAHEGHDYALWLSGHGVTSFVLKYRLGSDGYRHPRMLEDAARAVRLVRAEASRWNINPSSIGIMGSSAGGHLASTLLTHFDAGQAGAVDPVEREGSRPDFGILCYPVISMGPLAHEGSKQNLLGQNASANVLEALSTDRQVTAETPPCFIWSTLEDATVRVEHSLAFAAALRQHGVPFDLHIYEKGQHGLGLGAKTAGDPTHPWTQNLLFWLQERGFVKTLPQG